MSPSEKTNRRQFLKGESAVEAVPQLDADVPGTRSRRPHLMKLGRRAMACQFEFFLNGTVDARHIDDAIAALDLVDALEDQLTVYRDTSEICQINRTAHLHPIAVEPQLFQLLERSKQIYTDTNRAFDITAGPLSKVWGFFRREGRIPAQQDLENALERVGSRHLELDPSCNQVRFGRSQMEINLGGIGKGYALDRVADMLRTAGVHRFLLHGGQSSVLAAGHANDDGDGNAFDWSVGIRHPQRPEKRLVEVRLGDQALGTSGPANQYFHHRGKRYGHVIDPRTGWPVDGLLSATAITPSAALADALSTAFHVLGIEQTEAFCAVRPDVGAILISPAGGGKVHVDTFNLQPDRWQLV